MTFETLHPTCRISEDGHWRVRKLAHQRYEAQHLVDGHWQRFGRCVPFELASQAIAACEQAAAGGAR